MVGPARFESTVIQDTLPFKTYTTGTRSSVAFVHPEQVQDFSEK
jgi:hypothetical protein